MNSFFGPSHKRSKKLRYLLFLLIFMLSFGSQAQEGAVVNLFRTTVKPIGDYNKIVWITHYEHKTSHFLLERSSNQVIWAEIAQVEAIGKSETAQEYTVWDYAPLPGKSYYRVRTFNRKNDFEVGDPEVVNREGGTSVDIYQVADSTHIYEVKILNNQHKGSITLAQGTAKTIFAERISPADKYIRRIDFSELPKGYYYLYVTTRDGTIIRKMIKN